MKLYQFIFYKPKVRTGPEVLKNMLNSAEHEIFPAHKC